MPVHTLLLALLVLSWCFATPAQGQADDQDFSGDGPKNVTVPGRSALPGRGSGEVILTVRSFGLGNLARPGEWIPVVLEVSDSADKARNVVVRIDSPDLDNDTALMQRVIVTNPGVAQRVWLYLRLPFADASGRTFEITASEAVEAGQVGDVQEYVPGRMLGRLPYLMGMRQALPQSVGLIALVGAQQAGLDQYGWIKDTNSNYSITGHELTEVIPGLSLAGLPDRWHGYSGLQAIAWTSQASEDVPTNMRRDQAAAIRQWVERGGHLIIVLPSVGQQWVAQPNNPLTDIMPKVTVSRAEAVDMDRYRSLITRDHDVKLPEKTIVHSFTPDNAGPQEAIPMMVGPDGEIVVIRRIVGTGMVTVVGLDITGFNLHKLTHGFMADQFWNRLLGKRVRIPTPAEIDAGSKGRVQPDGTRLDHWDYSTSMMAVDGSIAGSIIDEGSAALGLLLAFVVFIAYWLVAGPIGYFVLKGRNWKQHAWVAFLGAAGLFTAIAWTGASVLRPRSVHGKHLTIVDGVYGQTTQRARSWMGLFLPRYGEQEVSVAAAATAGVEWENLLATWDPPALGGSSAWSTSFNDARGYVVDARKPDTAAFPARATTKQIQVDWAGVLPADWVLPHPVGMDSSTPIGREIRIVTRKEPKAGERKWGIEGKLVHNLPAAMKNVCVAVVIAPVANPPMEAPRRDMPHEMRMMAYMSIAKEWKTGQELRLDDMFDVSMGKAGVAGESATSALERLVPRRGGFGGGQFMQDYDASNLVQATAFYDMLAPPAAIKGNERSGERYALQRTATHGMDLSKWFTQPCIIIVGEVGDKDDPADLPIPVRVDSTSGDVVRKRVKGRTIVRWVYPLEPSPVTAYPLPKKSEDAPLLDGGGTGG